MASQKAEKKAPGRNPGNGQELEAPDVLEGEFCPFCHQKTLTLMEAEKEIPYFGKCYLFSMDCGSCKYHKADVESVEEKEPSRFTLEIEKEDDMKIRIIKSSEAVVKVPHVGEIMPGEASNGYITNVEGVLNRIKKQVEFLRDDAEEEEDKKKAKNLLKKLTRIMWGQEKAKLVIEDKTGNSAIISEKAVKEKMKG
ncbi:MAG: ZPR1 zinc finger domain-containing protein [Nanoarchaeota archaeon]